MGKPGVLDKATLRREYDRIAEDFDRTRQREWNEVASFLEDVDESELIVDAGCGNGRHLRLVEGQTRLAVGLDFSKRLLRIAKNKVRAEFTCGDVSSMPFKDNSFHRVLLIATLHHIPDEEMRINTIREARRVLRNGGKLLISVWSRKAEKLRGFDSDVRDVIVSWGKRAKLYYHIFDKNELERIVRQTGFTKVRVWESGTNIWLEAEK